MLRATLLAITVLCVAPVGAGAAVGQVAPIPGRGYDDCLQVTGLPGELVMPAPGGIRFVAATREGLKPGAVLQLADAFECGSVVSRANGAGVIAGAGREAAAVTVSVREPGSSTWGAPVTIALQAQWRPDVVRAAVSDRGDVVVAWRETRFGPGGSIRRLRVARRSPGGAFGPGEVLGKAAERHELVLPAVAATGEAFVLTTTAPDTGTPDHVPLRMWTAALGAAFGAPTAIGSMHRNHAPALAAAADGRVLVAWSDGSRLRVTEREPAGAFGAPVPLGAADGGPGFAVGVTLGPAGEAAVGWIRYGRGEARIASRRVPGAFGPPSRTVIADAAPRDQGFRDAVMDLYFGGATFTYDERPAGPVLGADGRTALAWSQAQRPVLTSAPLGGGSVSSAIPGRALRYVDAVQVLTLTDGTPAIVWSEPTRGDRFTLHLAAEGVPERPEPTVPRVTFGAPRSTTLSEQEALRLPVTCSGPCVVFAGLGDDATNGAFVTLPRGGRGELKIAAAFFAPRPAGPVKLSVRYRAPDGLRALTRTVRVRIARAADVPHPRVTDLRAVRRGGLIRVSWRVAGPIAKDEWPYLVSADATRAANGAPIALRIVEGAERRFAVTLRAGAKARFVTVRTALDTGKAVVRIQ